MAQDLTGRRALVTAGGPGLGRAPALTLARAGADVALTYRSHDGSPVAAEIEALGRRSWAVALDGFTRGLAKELGPRGITVSSIAPGFIGGTPFHTTFTPEAGQQAAVAGTPVGRAGAPAGREATQRSRGVVTESRAMM